MSQPPPLPPRRPDVSHLLKRRPPPPPPPPFPGQLLETTGGLFAQCAFPFSNLTRSSESSTTSTTIFRPHSNGRLALAWDAVVGEPAGVCTECFKSFFVPLGLEEEFVQSSRTSYHVNPGRCTQSTNILSSEFHPAVAMRFLTSNVGITLERSQADQVVGACHRVLDISPASRLS